MRSVSKKRAAENRAKPAVRLLVFERDGHCVLRDYPWTPVCDGAAFTPHHLEKAWKASGYTLENLVTLCSFHNTWVEDNPDRAHELGLVIRNGDTPSDAAARRAEHGIGGPRIEGNPRDF